MWFIFNNQSSFIQVYPRVTLWFCESHNAQGLGILTWTFSLKRRFKVYLHQSGQLKSRQRQEGVVKSYTSNGKVQFQLNHISSVLPFYQHNWVVRVHQTGRALVGVIDITSAQSILWKRRLRHFSPLHSDVFALLYEYFFSFTGWIVDNSMPFYAAISDVRCSKMYLLRAENESTDK